MAAARRAPSGGLKIIVKSRIAQIIKSMPVRIAVHERSAAEKIAVSANRRAPRLQEAIVTDRFQRYPGDLADSIRVDDPPGPNLRPEVVVGKFYGLFQEAGTRYMEPQPFLGPAVEEVENEFVGDVAGTLRTL